MLYRIYCLKNINNEIVYVGQTSRDLNIRLKEHRRKFPNRKEYTIHLLKETTDSNEADKLESYYIKLYNTVINGENVTYGKGCKGLLPKNSFKKDNLYCKMGTKKVECIETGYIYDSITDCSKKLNLNITNISACCRGKRKTTGKKHFRFI